MVGHQTNPEAWFPAFDITISPSFYDEGVPQTVMQSQACRIASIATDAGSTKDVIINRRTGLLIPMRNTLAIQQSIETLYTDRALRCQLAEQGYQTVLASFTQDSMLDAMEKIFSQSIQKAGWGPEILIPTALSSTMDIH